MSFSIRPAELADLDTIIDFNQRMAMETEGKSLNPGIIRHGVLAVLGDPAKGAYHLASGEQGTVGQMMITWEWSDWRNGNFWWIQSVYVRPEQRGKKVFSMLYRHVERLGRAGERLLRPPPLRRTRQYSCARCLYKTRYDADAL